MANARMDGLIESLNDSLAGEHNTIISSLQYSAKVGGPQPAAA